MQEIPDVNTLNTLAVLGMVLVISHICRIFDLIWLYFLRPSSVKRYMHGEAPYAIVTGATDGIGKATAAELLRRGFNVILHGRNEAKMRKVVKELRASSQADIRYFIADASRGKHDWARLLEPFEALHVTVVVHNVGGEYIVDTRYNRRAYRRVPPWRRALQRPLRAVPHARPPSPAAARRPIGARQVLFVGSLAGEVPPPRLPMYGASKGFLKALARGLDNDEHFFGAPTMARVRFTYITVEAVHSDNHPAPMPPSLAVPTSARFAWSLVESIGCGRREVVPYVVHAIQFWLMQLAGDRAVDRMAAQKMRELMAREAKGK